MTSPDRPLSIEPMTVGFDPAVIDDLHDRLRRTRRVPSMSDDDWAHGVAPMWLTDVLADWQAFDVAAFERRLAAFTHLRADIDGQSLHVIVAEGQGPKPLPLLLTNGWPSSFCEYLEVIPLLADPANHGGDPNDAFTVVVPAFPGFGFSAPAPTAGLEPLSVAHLWHDLMVGLGHPRFVAHGSDIGGRVVGQLARAHPGSVAAIHIATPGLPVPPQPWTPDEQAYASEFETWSGEEGGYAHEHSTKPATLGAGLHDSPAGLAAWIGEKLVAWSSLTADGATAFARELLLATLTVYWATGTITSSMLPYWNYRHTPGAALSADNPSPVPTAISLFGGERIPFPKPTREIAERYFNVVEWHEHDRGGHFPAAAEPELLVQTLRDAFRPFR